MIPNWRRGEVVAAAPLGLDLSVGSSNHLREFDISANSQIQIKLISSTNHALCVIPEYEWEAWFSNLTFNALQYFNLIYKCQCNIQRPPLFIVCIYNSKYSVQWVFSWDFRKFSAGHRIWTPRLKWVHIGMIKDGYRLLVRLSGVAKASLHHLRMLWNLSVLLLDSTHTKRLWDILRQMDWPDDNWTDSALRFVLYDSNNSSYNSRDNAELIQTDSTTANP